MAEPISDRIIQKLDQAAGLYHRLVILVGPSGAGKSAALRDAHERTDFPLVNVNLGLSRSMLELTERQRVLQLPRLLSDMVDAAQADVILLDNIELLFDVSLKHDPLRLLQGISRNTTLVAAWNGTVVNDHLIYATPDHIEYKRYLARDLLIVQPQAAT